MLSQKEFRKMDTVEFVSYMNRLIDQSYDGKLDIVPALSINFGHTSKNHNTLTDSQMLERSIKERRSVSKFAEYEEDGISFNMDVFVRETLEANLNKLSHWFTNSNEKFLEIEADYGMLTGYGFEKETGNKKTTSIISIYLERDYGEHSVFGFGMNTAFPNIDHKDAEYINQENKEKDIVDLIRKNPSDIFVLKYVDLPEIKNHLPEILKNKNISNNVVGALSDKLTIKNYLDIIEFRKNEIDVSTKDLDVKPFVTNER